MVLPIITSVIREVFSQTPPGEKEAALALGGTRWGMIRTVVLPYGRGGIIGGSMLGLGRALGETIAVVAAAARRCPSCRIQILAERRRHDLGLHRPPGRRRRRSRSSGLMAAGLVLFVITLATNMIASVVVARSRSGAGSSCDDRDRPATAARPSRPTPTGADRRTARPAPGAARRGAGRPSDPRRPRRRWPARAVSALVR